MSIYRFYFSSAPCGAGKTFQLVKRAAEWAKTGRRIIVLQPTKELIAKTVQQELLQLPGHPAFKVFNGDTVSGSVAAALTDYLKQPDDEGQIVFATHQVLPYIGFWPNKDAWDVLIDEEIQVHRHNSYEVPDTHRLMTDLIGLVPCNSIYSKVIVDHRAAMERIAKNEDQDEIYEQFRELAQTLVNGHWESFVNAEKYKKLKVGKSKTLSVHSVLNPSVLGGFGSVFMASANFTDTMVYRLWSQQGVEFREDQRLTESLRFQQHQNGHSITIKYADNRLWSKKLRLTKLNEKTTVTDAIVEAAIKEFQDRPFIWQANKNFSENPFGTNAKRLPNLPHGLNTYAVINNIVFLSSLNPAPDHFRFLKSRGVSGADVRRAIYCATAYQAVMRTSIRDRGKY
jgi:hypothetical protein